MYKYLIGALTPTFVGFFFNLFCRPAELQATQSHEQKQQSDYQCNFIYKN